MTATQPNEVGELSLARSDTKVSQQRTRSIAVGRFDNRRRGPDVGRSIMAAPGVTGFLPGRSAKCLG